MACTSHAISGPSLLAWVVWPDVLASFTDDDHDHDFFLSALMARFGLLLFLAAALGGVAATPLDEQVVFPGAPDERWSWKDCGKHQVVIQASATQL